MGRWREVLEQDKSEHDSRQQSFGCRESEDDSDSEDVLGGIWAGQQTIQHATSECHGDAEELVRCRWIPEDIGGLSISERTSVGACKICSFFCSFLAF